MARLSEVMTRLSGRPLNFETRRRQMDRCPDELRRNGHAEENAEKSGIFMCKDSLFSESHRDGENIHWIPKYRANEVVNFLCPSDTRLRRDISFGMLSILEFSCIFNISWMLYPSVCLRFIWAPGNGAKISVNDLKRGRLTIVLSCHDHPQSCPEKSRNKPKLRYS